jgi:hypothetical protein
VKAAQLRAHQQDAVRRAGKECKGAQSCRDRGA